VLYNICQNFRVPDVNEQENGGNYNFENHYDAQNHFFLQGQWKRDAFIDTYFNSKKEKNK
jgi:protein involved in sex pheromone biosynthesis